MVTLQFIVREDENWVLLTDWMNPNLSNVHSNKLKMFVLKMVKPNHLM